jgi:hypothetical protein
MHNGTSIQKGTSIWSIHSCIKKIKDKNTKGTILPASQNMNFDGAGMLKPIHF